MATARQIWDMSLEAIDLVDQRIAEFAIECDRVHGYMYVADSPRKARELEADVRSMERDYGFVSTWAEGADVQKHIGSERYHACAYETRSGHLHPLKYGLGLARAAQMLGVQIFEKSAVLAMERGATVTARTAQGQVRGKFALLSGNCTLPAYGPAVAPELAARAMPVGTYIVGTAPMDAERAAALLPQNAAVCDNNFVLDYFRLSADYRMLFGGRVSYTTSTPRNLQETMAQRMAKVFPTLKGVPIEFVWGGFVDISMNRAPDFGRLGDNIYYLQGFSGHGVALTGLAGKLVANAMTGEAEQFEIFSRLKHRKFPGGALLRTPSLVLGTLYHRLRDHF